MTPRITRVLLTTAFRPLSARAAPYAAMIATAHKAELHVLHVTPPPVPAADPAGPVPSILATPAPQELMSTGRLGVERFIRDHLPGWEGRAVAAVSIGPAAAEIVQYAADKGVDLIVMGTHGDGILRRIIFGSVSKSVVEHSPCPVMLVPFFDAPRT